MTLPAVAEDHSYSACQLRHLSQHAFSLPQRPQQLDRQNWFSQEGDWPARADRPVASRRRGFRSENAANLSAAYIAQRCIDAAASVGKLDVHKDYVGMM